MSGKKPMPRLAGAGFLACASLAPAPCGGDEEETTNEAATSTTTAEAAGPTGAGGSARKQAHIDVGTGTEAGLHLGPGQPAPEYETEPPTSGAHDPVPLADGAYLEAPDPRHYVHSLEHGRVAIQYSPDLPQDDQLLFKGVFDEEFDGVLLFPNPDMPYDVAVTAWRNLAGCESFSGPVLDVVRDFHDEFLGKGAERVPL
jgi:hypothetical protein